MEQTPPTSQARSADAMSIRARTYRMLDQAREEKKRQLQEYFDRLKALADQACADKTLRDCFDVHVKFHRLGRTQTPPREARQALARLRRTTGQYYLEEYQRFSDIFFVASDGSVLYSVRHPEMIGRNFFRDEFRESSLSRRLQEQPEDIFVDFEASSLFQNPCGYFVEPIRVDDECSGWILLQCPIRRINTIFTRHKDLGQTGEVFLVNEHCQMLTDSRFRAESSILKLHLSAENIRGKFAEGKGHKTVTDYRGFRALTSFEVCPILDSRWLLIAKIDQAEVLTEYYRQHRQELRPALLDRLRRQTPLPADNAMPSAGALVVNMDEFRRSADGQPLLTHGVSTCTAVTICLPGEFCYLGHASCYDVLYGQGNLDMTAQMIQQIRRYEIPPYRMRNLRITVVAPHTESIANAIDAFVDAGLLLTQIRFLHNPRARSGMVWHDPATEQTVVRWSLDEPAAPHEFQTSAGTPRVGDCLQSIVPY